jgi:hypothetical protein
MKICRRLSSVPLSKLSIEILDRALFRIDFRQFENEKIAPFFLQFIDLFCEMVKGKSVDEIAVFGIQPETAA